MILKEILSNTFANVSYDSDIKSILTIWKKPSTSDGYKDTFSLILEKLQDYKANGFISDIFNQGIVGIENRIWLQNEIIPKAYPGGLRKIATISPNNVFSKFYMERIKNEIFISAIELEFRYFQD